MNLQRRLLIGAGIGAALLLVAVLTVLFIPTREIQGAIARGLEGDGYTIKTGDFRKAFPLGVKGFMEAWSRGGPHERANGKIALMWSHANPVTAKALDGAGVRGVITFAAQDRYFDPDQVLYSGGSYAGFKNLKFGLTVSWRQWTELLDEVERGSAVTARRVYGPIFS